MPAARFDDPEQCDLRQEALEGLLVALVRASLRPVTQSDLTADALRMLDEHWADVRAAELEEVMAEMQHDAIERDRWGFRAIHPARTLDDAWPHLVAAARWADVASVTEGHGAPGSDRRARRGLFATPLLHQYEEIHLGARCQRGDQVARNKLIEANTRWLLELTRRFSGLATTSMDFDDLFQSGALGLIRAAEKFDPTYGSKFATYATWWIRQAIQRGVATDSRTIDIPVHIHDRLKRVEREERRYERQHGHPPAARKLADLAGISLQQLREVKLIPVAVPLDEGIAEVATDRLESSVEEVVEGALTQHAVRHALRLLPEREKLVLEERYGLYGSPRTLDDIGQELDLTRERIRQIETQALKRLRVTSGVRSLGPVGAEGDRAGDADGDA